MNGQMSNNQNQYTVNTPDWVKPYLDKAAQIYGIPTLLLSAQLEQESGFKQRARGRNRDSMGRVLSTDRGIAQINDRWHPEITDQQADDPAWAIDWMARTMSEKMGRYGDWGKALSEYNTGNPDKGFTNGYVQNVASRAGVPVSQGRSNLLASAIPMSPSGTSTRTGTSVTSQSDTSSPALEAYFSRQAQEPRQYTVQKGDTLWDLAQKFLGSGTRWRELGFGGDPRHLPIGQALTIPGRAPTSINPTSPTGTSVVNRTVTPQPIPTPGPTPPPAQTPARQPYVAPQTGLASRRTYGGWA